MSQGTNPTYNGEGKTTLLNMIHSAPDKAELTGYKPYITGVLTSGDAADDSFLRNHLGRVYYSSLHYAGLDNLIGDSVDGSFRPITLTGLYEGTAGSSADTRISLLLHFDGSDGATTTTDDGPDERTITLAGNAQLDTAQKKFGTASLLLDGNGDLASAADDGDFDFGSGDFTVEGFFRISSLGNNVFFSHWENGDAAGQSFYLVHFNGSNTLRFAYRLTTGIVESSYTWEPSADTFYHIAVVRYGTTLKVYIDGVAVISDSVSTTSLIASEDPFRIGAFNDATTASPTLEWEFAGHVDEVRVTKGQARYIANFVPTTSAFEVTDATAQTQDPYFSNVKFLSSFDGSDGDTTTSGLDESSSDLDLTYNSGDELSTTQKKFGTTSLYVADNVIISSSDGFNMGTGEFTIEGWYYFTSFSNSFSIYDQWNGSATGAGNVQMWMSHSTAGKVKWYYDGSSLLQSNTTMSTGQWYHIAFVRESGTLKMYFNGALDSNTQSYSGQFGKTGTVYLGDQHATGGGAPQYFVDELRATKGTARYTAAFAAPTAAFLGS